MTTKVIFLRHGTHDLIGRVLCGRMEGVSLNEEGRAQAARAARRLAEERPIALYVSPLARARETAAPLAAALNTAPTLAEALNEIEIGRWTGAAFEQLQEDRAWRLWNEGRSHHRPPGGESMVEVQVRVARWFGEVLAAHPDQTVVAVCHADVIKAGICHAAGLSLDHHHRIEVSPGSLSVLLVGEWGLKVHSINEVPR